MPGVIAPPPLIYLSGLAIGFGLEGALPSAELPGVVRWLIGPALLAAGLALMGSFISSFRRAATPVPMRRPTTALVTTGPYRFTRNPGYLGMALIGTAIGLIAGAVWVLAGIGVAVLVINWGVINREERYLEAKFGSPYREYKARVRRWV